MSETGKIPISPFDELAANPGRWFAVRFAVYAGAALAGGALFVIGALIYSSLAP